MIQPLISGEERLWIAQEGSVMLGHDKGMRIRVIDLEKAVPQMLKDRKDKNLSMYIDIIPISEDRLKSVNYSPTFSKDRQYGVYYGIAIGTDNFGNVNWQRIPMGDHLNLNLERNDEAKQWAVLRMNSYIAGSPYVKDTPRYRVLDAVADANRDLKEIDQMMIAFERTNKLRGPDLVHFARYLGEDLKEVNNELVVLSRVKLFAKKYPAEFNRRFDAKDRGFAELFHSGLELGVIEHDVEKGFVYKGIHLGLSLEDAVKYLSENSDVTSGLRMSVNEIDILSDSVKKGKEKDSNIFI